MIGVCAQLPLLLPVAAKSDQQRDNAIKLVHVCLSTLMKAGLPRPAAMEGGVALAALQSALFHGNCVGVPASEAMCSCLPNREFREPYMPPCRCSTCNWLWGLLVLASRCEDQETAHCRAAGLAAGGADSWFCVKSLDSY